MNRMPCLLVLLSGFSVISCVGVRQKASHVYQGSTIPFTRVEVVGWRYDLLSMHDVFSIRFKPDGHAPATIGSGNALEAKGYRWEIDLHGRLHVSDDKGSFVVYQLLSMTRNKAELWDMTNGHANVFVRTPPNERLKD